MTPRVGTERGPEALHRGHDAGPLARLHGGPVRGDVESRVRQFMDEREIVSILERLGSRKITAALRARDRPYGLRGAKTERQQKAVHGRHILDGRNVSV